MPVYTAVHLVPMNFAWPLHFPRAYSRKFRLAFGLLEAKTKLSMYSVFTVVDPATKQLLHYHLGTLEEGSTSATVHTEERFPYKKGL